MALLLLATPALPVVYEESSSYSREGVQAAFERVYSEGRWLRGQDGALCASGWSAVAFGQAVKAMDALVSVVEAQQVRSLIDMPVGDGCFSRAALAAIRAKNHSLSYTGYEVVGSLVRNHRLLHGDEETHFEQADLVTLDWFPPRAL